MTRLAAPLLLLMLSACRPAEPTETAPLRAETQRGPFRFSIELTPPAPAVGDRLQLTLAAVTPATHAVRFPDDADLDPLEVITRTDREPAAETDGHLRWQRVIQAEVYESGPLEIPPLVLGYGVETDGELVVENELATDALTFEVRSALTSQDALTSPRDITGTRLPDPLPWTWRQWTVVIGLAAVTAALVAWLARVILRRLHAPPPPIPAEVTARAELAPLRDDAWLRPERLQEYHYRLSEIVRTYVENQFGIAAPEMTTEEFLRTIAAARGGRVSHRFTRGLQRDAGELRLLGEHAATLQGLLEGCDLVKYGSFAPPADHARQAWSEAARFVDDTAESLRRQRAAAGPTQEAAA